MDGFSQREKRRSTLVWELRKTLLEKRNTRLGKQDNVQSLMEEYLHRNTVIKNEKLSQDPEDINNNSGIFQVSVRRQNDCLVSGGYMLVGDSAWMPKPIDAGGIGPALIAGDNTWKQCSTSNRTK